MSASKELTTTTTTSSGGEIPVSIVGYSLRAPNCSSVAEFAEALEAGKDLTTSNTRYPSGLWGLPPRQGRLKDEDLNDITPTFFGLSRKMAEKMDPAVRLLLKVSYEALMDAQIDIQAIRGSRTGVYAGHCFCDLTSIRNVSDNFKESSMTEINGYEILGTAHCMAANRLSYFYDFKGPSLTMDTACSSSLLALDRAARDIKAGIIERALVCGISLTLDHCKNVILVNAKMLSPTGHCHVFDSRADGYCRADGVGCVVLERGSRGYAQIVASGTNQDGATVGITYPSSEMQHALMSEVFLEYNIDPRSVVYHEAHGTGTVAGDQQELAALSKTFEQEPLVIGSVKSNMGHSEGASGLMGLAKILLMMEDQKLYPNHDFQESPHDAIKSGKFSILTSSQSWEPGLCTISNFGFGGSNVFAILKPCPQRRTLLTLPKVLNVAPFSAAPGGDPSAGHSAFYGIQRAIGNDRPFRFHFKSEKWRETSPLVYVCDGQGSQWNNMGQDLMKDSQVFRTTMERLESETGIPLVSMYEDGSKWMLKTNSVIGIVSFQLGIIAILAEQGIQPDYFLGHSLGEIPCAYLAGLQSEAEALLTAKVRSELASMIDKDSRLDVFSSLPSEGYSYEMMSPSNEKLYVKKVPHDSPSKDDVLKSFSMMGKMVVVGCDAEVARAAIDKLNLHQTVVACFNSPRGQTISGPATEVDQLVEYLKVNDMDLFIRNIPTDNIAYHAPYLEVFREDLKARFWKIRSQRLPPSWISTSRNDVFNVDYLLDNICHSVHFQEAIKSLPRGATVVEIGPSSGLLAQVRRSRNDLKPIVLVEREKPVDLTAGLSELLPWKSGDERKPVEQINTNAALHYNERYPELWGEHTKFLLPSWDNYERFQKTISTVTEVTYDLTKDPWSSIKDHCLRGQCLFPAAGFLHILWSAASYKEHTEILDFRVLTPMALSKAMKKVEFHLHRAGQYCEIRDTKNEMCYALGRVQPVSPHSAVFQKEDVALEDETSGAIPAKLFYDHCDYGPKYCLLETCTTETATMTKPSDFVAYVDAALQMLSLTDAVFLPLPEGIGRRDIPFPVEIDATVSFPVGLDRFVYWEKDLEEVDLWLRRRGANTVGNTSILLEGLRREHVQVVHRPAALHAEEFVEYKSTDDPIPPSLVAAVVLRESFQFSVIEPVLSDDLNAVIKILRDHILAQESQSCTAVVFSDMFSPHADLLVTTDTLDRVKVPFCLVARWGNIRLVRLGSTSISSLKVVSSWSEVPAASETFIWQGDGSSGAATSLSIERGQTILSYPPSSAKLIGLEKRMRVNFLLEEGGQSRHGVWVDVNQAETSKEKTEFTPFVQLRISRPGILDSLAWTAIDPELYPIKVETATLNFRDIMRALGKLKETDPSLGHEFSGFDTRRQQRVFGLGRNTLASHCHAAYTFPIPDHLCYEEAATIPLVYLTAYYAMLGKAEMKKGQSILIHAGAGGVGFAAINIALRRGFKVFTTCSASKLEFLKERFGLSNDQIGDSRSDDFVRTVMNGTSGRGVDVVLNHLAGPLQIASLRCVADGGHFCEIGKFDAHVNSKLGQALLINNVSFHIIDLRPLIADLSYKPIWDSYFNEGFDTNEIVPLPTTAFDATDIIEAFRFMSQAKHIGKIIINGFGKQHFKLSHSCCKSWRETHLITGGLGGLGFALATRLAFNGSPELTLVGRKGVTTQIQRHRIQQLKRLGCKVTVIKGSVLDLTSGCSKPDRIWHVANVYRDVAFDEMTEDHWDDVVHTKVDGYHHLRKCWPTTPIVAISSVVAYYGNMAQVHYASANASLDAAARRDHNTISIRLGAVNNVGYVTQSRNHLRILQRSPFELMPISDVLDRLLQITADNKSGVFGVYDLKKTSKKSLLGSDQPFTLQDAQRMLADILGGEPEQYYPTLSLTNSGLDSLSLMEVVYQIHEVTGAQDFKPSDVNQDFLVQDIVTIVAAARKQPQGQQTATNPTATAPQADLLRKKSSISSATGPDTAEKGTASSESSQTKETTSEESSQREKVNESADLAIEEHTMLATEPLQLRDLLSVGGIADKSLNELHAMIARNGLGQTTLKQLQELMNSERRSFPTREEWQLVSFGEKETWSQERKIAALCLTVPAIWWVISLATHGVGEVDKVLLYALAVFNLFLLIRLFVDWGIAKGIPIRDPVACTHSLQHLAEFALYVILYVIGSETFFKYWQSIFFGYYTFDALSVLLFWEGLVQDYRFFIVTHHGLAFLFTGFWRLRDQIWDKHLALAMILWLTGGVWQHVLLVYRHFYGPRTVVREYLPYLFAFAFAWERAHRIAAYCVGAILVGNSDTYDEKAMYAATVFLLDVLDIWYEFRSIRKLFRARPATQVVEQVPVDPTEVAVDLV